MARAKSCLPGHQLVKEINVTPAQAGVHHSFGTGREILVTTAITPSCGMLEAWVPAFAGTTSGNLLPDS